MNDKQPSSKTAGSVPQEKQRILRARARALAQKPGKPAEPEDYLEVLEFSLAHERYALEISFVREVYPLKELTPLPGTPPFILGIINVRGQILSVMDLKRFFNLPQKGLSDLNKSGKHISINKFQLKGGHMRITTFCLILIASLSWSILPSWAQLDEKTPRTKADKEIQSMTDPGSPLQPGLAEYTIGPLCQMGGGMMGGGGPCGGPYGPGAGMGPEPQAPPRALNQNSGAGLFAAYCAGCHPGGGNNIMPDLPIVGSEELEDFDTFHSYMRSPTLPNGAHGPMPGFSSSQISTRQMRTLYRFLKSVYGD